jgi:hypothetical protein
MSANSWHTSIIRERLFELLLHHCRIAFPNAFFPLLYPSLYLLLYLLLFPLLFCIVSCARLFWRRVSASFDILIHSMFKCLQPLPRDESAVFYFTLSQIHTTVGLNSFLWFSFPNKVFSAALLCRLFLRRYALSIIALRSDFFEGMFDMRKRGKKSKEHRCPFYYIRIIPCEIASHAVCRACVG